jgi:hypothetical protein
MRAGDAGDHASGFLDGTGVDLRGCGARSGDAEGTLSDELASRDEKAGGFAVEGFAFFGGEVNLGFEAL